MPQWPNLDRYRLHEREYDDLEAVRASVEWERPAAFNVAYYSCRRWRGADPCLSVDAGGEQSTWSFEEVDRLSDRIATLLQQQGVARRDRVWVRLPTGPAALCSCLAAWKVGAIAVPASTGLGDEEATRRFRDCDPTAVVRAVGRPGPGSDASVPTTTVEDAGSIDGPRLVAAVEDDPERLSVARTAPDHPAFIVYTSGSTGRAKGVVHSHGYLLGYIPGRLLHGLDLHLDDGTVTWAIGDVAWIAPLSNVLFSWFFGRPAIVRPAAFAPDAALAAVERNRVTDLFAPPTALRRIEREASPERYDLASVRRVLCGGEPVDPDLLDRSEATFDAPVQTAYGQTELNIIAGETTRFDVRRRGTVGRPSLGREVRIVDPEHGTPLEPGEFGEISVRAERGLGRMLGYWTGPDATYRSDDGWLRTGDLGRIDDGYLVVDGRKADVILCGGHRIRPTEVERTLLSHEAVADCTVVGVPDEVRGEIPKAYVVPVGDVDPDRRLVGELQAYVRTRLGRHEYPRDVEIRAELPDDPANPTSAAE